jgi:hypothetical protein
MYKNILWKRFRYKEFDSGEFLTVFIEMYPYYKFRPTQRSISLSLMRAGLVDTVYKASNNWELRKFKRREQDDDLSRM